MEADKKLSLWKLPGIQIVQLKRFVYTNNVWRSKDDRNVLYPHRSLDFRPYLCQVSFASL